jgi:hypothetical protein
MLVRAMTCEAFQAKISTTALSAHFSHRPGTCQQRERALPCCRTISHPPTCFGRSERMLITCEELQVERLGLCLLVAACRVKPSLVSPNAHGNHGLWQNPWHFADAHGQLPTPYGDPDISLQHQISLKTCCFAAASQAMASSCESEIKS